MVSQMALFVVLRDMGRPGSRTLWEHSILVAMPSMIRDAHQSVPQAANACDRSVCYISNWAVEHPASWNHAVTRLK